MAGDGPELEPRFFARQDDSDDAAFYMPPRLVHHLDEPARAALTDFYGEALPDTARVLDLMSSWVSHLPDDRAFAEVAGLGMNAEELDANPRLTHRVVHDLNADPGLPFDNAAFDACLIALSIQYLTKPIDVFAQIARVLVPGGTCIVSFSNRCFPTKAVAIWDALDDSGHVGLVVTYFRKTEGFEEPVFEDLSPMPGRSDPLFVVHAQTKNPLPEGEGLRPAISD